MKHFFGFVLVGIFFIAASFNNPDYAIEKDCYYKITNYTKRQKADAIILIKMGIKCMWIGSGVNVEGIDAIA